MTPLELEHDGWRALCGSSAADFYGAIMRQDALMVLANGQTMTRDQVVEALSQAPPWASYEISDERTVELGDDTVVLTYVGTGHRDEGTAFRGVMSSVYERDDSSDAGWTLVLYQQTEIPNEQPPVE